MLRKKTMKKRKGAVLIWALVALIIVTMIATTVAMLTTNNLRMASTQDESIRTYYVARSGAEIAYEGLLTITPSLITEFEDDIDKVIEEDDMDLGEGLADIKVSSYMEDGMQRISIESIGKMKDSNFTKKVVLDFAVDNLENIRWKY